MSEAVAALAPSELVLGRYRPLRPLGTGGSGSVWLARDERSGLDVALKIVPREGKAASRAEREAAAATRLRHERCLRAYAFERDEQHVYIAYEYVPGRTVRDAIRAGALDDRAAVEAGAQILEGLAHAHEHGIVHRDVKPSNVLLADGEGVSVRLLDFGLAQMQEAETLTAAGDVPGTLAYIAPERLAGAAAGAASDVWGVGVLMWEALAGFHPFWRSSLLETARAIEAGAPPLASERPDLPKALLHAVDRALSLDPARRPSAERLARILRLSYAERERRRGRRGRTPLALPHAALRLAPAGLAGTFAGASAAVLPFYPAGGAAALAVLATVAAYLRPRAGLALALAAPVFPLGNVSLGLALLYGALALGWLALAWTEPESGLLVALGPVAAPLQALGVLPLAAAALRPAPVRTSNNLLLAAVRRAAQVGAGVLVAAVVAGLRGASLPFGAGAAPRSLGIAGSDDPLAVASVLLNALEARPGLALEALALAALAAVLPLARARGLWGIAVSGAAMVATTLVAAPAAAAAPLVAATWVTCAVLALTRES